MITRYVCSLILYDKEHKVLMQHRSDDAPRLAGYWGMFGGGIEEGETPEQALVRELMEEIEYKVVSSKLFCVDEFNQEDGKSDTMHIVSHTFIEPYDITQPIVQHEGQGYGWFSVDEALKLKITPHRRENLIKAKEFFKNLSH